MACLLRAALRVRSLRRRAYRSTIGPREGGMDRADRRGVGGEVPGEAERRFGLARAAARRAADEVARGVVRGPLRGVPSGAKDIFYSAGLRTEAGSKVMAGFVLRPRI